MPDKGKKEQDGSEKKTTILQLTPVKYAITLHYLGENYIERDENKYRCKFELQNDAGGNPVSIEADPTKIIGNVVPGENPDDTSKNVATPDLAGRGLGNPANDRAYRVLVTDNHTLPASDSSLLGSPSGDNRSRPAYYRLTSRKWMKDVIPAAPFRIIVRKYQGPDGSEEQVDLDDTLKVYMEIKDPVEESVNHGGLDGGPVKECQKDFFKKYNRTDADPNVGDDNMLNRFGGYRRTSDSKSGVMPTNVIKRADYIKPPTPATVLPNELKINQLKQIRFAPGKSQWAKFDLTTDTLQDGGNELKIGISDFAFRPKPVGGDNYRFLLWLVDSGGKDVREKKINGDDVKLVDHDLNAIPLPRTYCTGRFIVWRRVDIRLLITANNLAAGDINWGTVRDYYRHVFTDINGPIETVALTREDWRSSLTRVFNGGNATNGYQTDANFSNAEYTSGLFPAFIRPLLPILNPRDGGLDPERLCEDILNNKILDLAPVEDPPLTAKKRNIEKSGEGIYVIYVKDNSNNLLGSWSGNGRLLVAEDDELNETLAHEMAHGFFMRHANTATQQVFNPATNRWVNTNVTFKPAAGADQNIQLIDPTSNCFPEDHDQDYSFKCIMSYLELEQFCGICALTLRFANRVAIQQQNRFQDRIMRGFFEDTANANNAAKIVQLDDTDPNNFELNETIPNVQINHKLKLMAIGPVRQYTAAGAARNGRVNLTCAHKRPDTLWRSSNTRNLTVKTAGGYCAEVTAKRAGTATVTYARNGKTVTANITVTN